MKKNIINFLFLASFSSLIYADIIIREVPSSDDKKDEKKEDLPDPPKEEPVILPGDVRQQLKINFLNLANKPAIVYVKVKAATGASPSKVQAWEYLKVYTLVRESGTLATLSGRSGATYEFERSRIDAFDPGGANAEYLRVECKVTPSMAGKTASKSITLVLSPVEDVLTCLVYYDRDLK